MGRDYAIVIIIVTSQRGNKQNHSANEHRQKLLLEEHGTGENVRWKSNFKQVCF